MEAIGMYLGGTGCTAAAVTSGTSAEQDDDIARIGSLTDDIFARSSAHNSTDLHTLCHIIGMINLFYITGSQTDLVTVGAVTAVLRLLPASSADSLPCKCLRYRNGRICCTGHTHCLIYIATAGQRITDSTAQTGGSATERLDLCRMVVGLVLEKLPATPRSLCGRRNPSPREPRYGAGIDLIRFFHDRPACRPFSASALPSAPDPSGRRTYPLCP